jgi:ATP-dependent helicase HrpB
MRLPVDEVLDDLGEALCRGHAVLQAPTGSGKSTGVPLALLDADWLAGRDILMLEPRRPAARMTAARMAALLGESVGETVGYQVRFDRHIGSRTRIQVLTEGILTRRLQSDPALEGVGAVVFDELHEMNLHAELGLALTLDVIDALRPDLRILAMSATLDAEPVAALLGDAPVIRGGGRGFAVEVRYAERPMSGRELIPAVAAAVRRALADQAGDVLAFLPGSGEINRCLEQLAGLSQEGVEVLPLHGGLMGRDQDRALVPGGGHHRRVVLATDIAETSVTIQGIGAVVDSGLTRKPRFQPAKGMTRLVTESVSLASAEQRAGRAGRLGPGICYRLWTKAQEHGRPAHRTPEILQADLAPLVLELALWGVADPGALKWMNAPPAPAWAQARGLLNRLGALDRSGLITERGRTMAGLPVHPRLAAMLAEASPAESGLAADLAALVSEPDPMIKQPNEGRLADLDLRLQALASFRSGQDDPRMDRRRLAAADRAAKQLLQLAVNLRGGVTASAGALLAMAYPDRVAQVRENGKGRYLLRNGAGAMLQPEDPLAASSYLVIADMDARGRDGHIRLALSIVEDDLQELFSGEIIDERVLSWDRRLETVTAREISRLDVIVLAARPASLEPTDDVTGVLLQAISGDPDGALPWTRGARQLQARVALLRREDRGGDWPDLSAGHLRATLSDWLSPWIEGMSSQAQLRRLDLESVLRSQLSWGLQQRLDREAPAALITPAGTRRRIDYDSGGPPVLSVPLQEMLGASETPSICNGRVRLLIRLLSPAQRPIQVTQDLAGFWSGSYAEVRKEMRGRYPKHYWPEDPACASPMARSLKARK